MVKLQVEEKKLFSINGQFDVKTNNLVTTFSIFPKEYEIVFEVFLSSFTTGNDYCLCANLFRFTSGNDDGTLYKNRLLAAWFFTSRSLTFDSFINGTSNRVENVPFTLGWKKFNISQLLFQGVYISTIQVDGIVISSRANIDAKEFYNVKLYFSDPWYLAQPGYTKNLSVTKGCSETNMYCKPQLNVAYTGVINGNFLNIRFDTNYSNAEESAVNIIWEYILPPFLKLESVHTSVDAVIISANKYAVPHILQDRISQSINISVITTSCLVCRSYTIDIPMKLYYENNRGSSWKSMQTIRNFFNENCSIIQTNPNYIQDSDECTQLCNWTEDVSINNNGNYICTCSLGWYLGISNYSCIDINECNSSNKPCNWTNSVCKNTAGSFICSCASGWTLNENNDSCVDINECNSSNKPCNWTNSVCRNTAGSFICSCVSGWSLDENNGSCVDINECNSLNIPCNWTNSICKNTAGSFICSCASGWSLNENNDSCVDINECNSSIKPCNWTNSICKNTAGSFICSCASGWNLNENNDSCVDINECNSSIKPCNWTNSICKNTAGSFICSCVSGWSLDENNGGCVDINECDSSVKPCNWTDCVCKNTVGSYICSCASNMSLDKNNDGFVGNSTMWSECSETCGFGYKYSYLKPLLSSHQNESQLVEKCINQICPVDGKWSTWIKFESCSNQCGICFTKRKRICSNPEPAEGGYDCLGLNLDIQYIDNDMLCPVHGGWTQWSLWSLCSQPCHGVQTRHRSCTNPIPKYNGLPCSGNNTEHSTCYSYECKKVSLNLNIFFMDEEYIELYSDPTNEPSLNLNNRIKVAIQNLYYKYNNNVQFDVKLRSIKDGVAYIVKPKKVK
ncbi:fibulin-2 isoform X10 [Hydra vulgaris]|uniref:Fibulin-2 isoform X10 n=1 Tax=Hydra vulgaris TaxID=6087 RepID=A0ABM4DKH3_HYDVU